MATNVTTDSIEFFIMRLEREEKYLRENIERITHYNEVTIPEKRATYEAMNIKKAEKGKELLVFNLEPIDIDTATQVIGIRRAIGAYKSAIALLSGEHLLNTSTEDLESYIKYFEQKRSITQHRLDFAEKRLEGSRRKREALKKSDPKKYEKKYHKRGELPEGDNREVINDKRILAHYDAAITLLKQALKHKSGVSVSSKTRNDLVKRS